MKYVVEKFSRGNDSFIIEIRNKVTGNGLVSGHYFLTNRYAEIKYHYSFESDYYFRKVIYVCYVTDNDEQIVSFLLACASMVFL